MSKGPVKTWWGESVSGPPPSGFIRAWDAAGRLLGEGHAGGFQWNVVGHSTDLRSYQEIDGSDVVGRFGRGRFK